MPDSKKIIKKCIRCHQLFNEKKQVWDGSESTEKTISNFNNNSLLSMAFGKIEFEEVFCPYCQNLLPNTSVEKFRERLAVSEKFRKKY
ncbi:MAG: hypothetical protein WCJ57_01645 [Candidatus Falkowbacteria bacterium]